MTPTRPSFLSALSASEQTRQKLAELGADTPLALLCMRQASPEAFDAFIGEPAESVATELLASLSPEERAFFQSPTPLPAYPLGARLD